MNKTIITLISFLFFIAVIVVTIVIVITGSNPKPIKDRYWIIESVDTMKYSRDASRDPEIYKIIPKVVKQVANLNANYIAIATPYDEEFYPVLKAWVNEARKYHLRVWFRGNFSSWEGWFGYPTFTDINQDHILIHNFILRHPDLFQDGDIFTPVPEPENGGMGDPRGSDKISLQFNQFLVNSYQNCVVSFSQIHKNILCGFFSVNADVAKQVLTKQTVKKTGNIIVIDNYVENSQKMNNDINYLYNKFHAKIVLGEYGAPIPDINGAMTDNQQASFIKALLDVFYKNKNKILGINYWVGFGGSTALYNDNGTPKPATYTVKNYYGLKVIRY